ncbi:MAG TPA: penicillin-binding transpeptidase domain-containing protein [Pyrinomonadaceae bacterium]
MSRVFDVESFQILYGLAQGLLHSIWQCAVVAFLLAGALALLRGSSSNVRYVASCCAMALMLLLPSATVWKFLNSTSSAQMVDASEVAGAPGEFVIEPAPGGRLYEKPVTASAGSLQPAWDESPTERAARLLPWLTLVWLTGVMLLSARTLGGLVLARRMKLHGARPVSGLWLERAAEIARKLSVSGPVKVLESSLVSVPTAVGWLRPAILLPASAFTGLTPQQLEAVLAHELAHVRRNDYLVNVLQTAVETLLFYHPAVWWVSRQIRAEREHVCDDMAVRVTGDAMTYARALTRIERLRTAAPRLALGADGGSLRSRVTRLVEGPPSPRHLSPLLVGLFLIVGTLTAVVCARAVIPKKHAVKPTPRSLAADAEAEKSAGDDAGAQVHGSTLTAAGDDTEGEDAEVRRVAVEALGGRDGAVVVMDPRTGRVFAVVNQEWALRRGWVPASTMKLVTGLAGVGEGLFDPLEKMRVQGRGERLDLTGALALSDNAYFKSVNGRVGAGLILDYARRLGLGEPTGINHEGEVAGRLPSAETVASVARLGVGEGVEVTPVQLAVLVSALGNGGKLVVPRVPRAPRDATGEAPVLRREVGIPEGVRNQIIPGMIAAVERGTASGIGDPTLKIAGKTGTLAGREGNIGLFASYAPADSPRLTVVVLTQGDGVKGATAAKIAGAIYKALRGRLAG